MLAGAPGAPAGRDRKHPGVETGGKRTPDVHQRAYRAYGTLKSSSEHRPGGFNSGRMRHILGTRGPPARGRRVPHGGTGEAP